MFFGISDWGIDLDYSDIEWFALETKRDHSVIFEIGPKYCILGSFVDYDWNSISSILAHSCRYNGHLSYIHPFQFILVCWFLKCRCSFLPSPVWPLPICLDSWTVHSRFLYNIALYNIGLYFPHQSHPQLGVVLLWFCLFFLSGVCSPLISSSILGTYWPWEFIFQCHTFLPFHSVRGVLKVRILKWFAITFSSGPHFVRTLHHDPSILGGPTWHGS